MGTESEGPPRATFVGNLLINSGVETTGTHTGQNGAQKSHPGSSGSSR